MKFYEDCSIVFFFVFFSAKLYITVQPRKEKGGNHSVWNDIEIRERERELGIIERLKKATHTLLYIRWEQFLEKENDSKASAVIWKEKQQGNMPNVTVSETHKNLMFMFSSRKLEYTTAETLGYQGWGH